LAMTGQRDGRRGTLGKSSHHGVNGRDSRAGVRSNRFQNGAGFRASETVPPL